MYLYPCIQFIYLSTYTSIKLSIYLSIYLLIYPSIYRNIYQLSTIYLYIFKFIHLSTYTSINLSIYLHIYLPIYLFTCPCINLSIHPSLYMSVWLSISLHAVYGCLSLHVCLAVCLSAKCTIQIHQLSVHGRLSLSLDCDIVKKRSSTFVIMTFQ